MLLDEVAEWDLRYAENDLNTEFYNWISDHSNFNADYVVLIQIFVFVSKRKNIKIIDKFFKITTKTSKNI